MVPRHPGSSKTEKDAGDHSSHAKEPHHHHGAEAAAAGAAGAHEHKKHEHKKEEHKRDVPAHERMTTTHAHQQGAGIPTSRAHDHHTGRDAALGAGAVGVGTAAHYQKYHQHEAPPRGADPMLELPLPASILLLPQLLLEATH